MPTVSLRIKIIPGDLELLQSLIAAEDHQMAYCGGSRLGLTCQELADRLTSDVASIHSSCLHLVKLGVLTKDASSSPTAFKTVPELYDVN